MAGVCNILCLVAIAVTVVTATDYCNVKSCTDKSSHTMCKYSSASPAEACNQSNNIGLSNADKNAIVAKHNELRQKVASGQETRGRPGPQPAAVNMPNLVWDDELAMIAQKWANQCNFSHDKCRNSDRFAVGQNIAKTMHSGENTSSLQSMIQMWYDEVDKFDKNGVSSYKFSPETGHYTQLVWATTTKIGCGRIMYKSNGWNNHFLVCNYGPSGNWIGNRIYEKK
ncbi:PREDICTED: venom allergen 3-like [Vollenhovia emeryi]|uniref:venom allergen 3-like n=1 Tax=Vollenhovia emeryi TaxID=411798 RepID=UPI0005F413D0|nr:PREDICTED: venom allergen 3-like [Vollenhovia emeryi]